MAPSSLLQRDLSSAGTTHKGEERLDLPGWDLSLGSDSSWDCPEAPARRPWQTRVLLTSGWPEAEDWTWSWRPFHMSVVALSKRVGSLLTLSSSSRRIAGVFSVSSMQDKYCTGSSHLSPCPVSMG